jgi:hypothetical protein
LFKAGFTIPEALVISALVIPFLSIILTLTVILLPRAASWGSSISVEVSETLSFA